MGRDPERPEDGPGLIDKAAWHTVVKQRVVEAAAGNKPLSVLFVDVNNLKEINDSLGHMMGDVVLEQVSTIVGSYSRLDKQPERRSSERQPNLISVSQAKPPKSGVEIIDQLAARVGGDEFAILSETDEAGVKVIIQRIKAAFDEFLRDPKHEALIEAGAGIAVGGATLRPGMRAPDLLHEADQAMYRDKVEHIQLSIGQIAALGMIEDLMRQHNLRPRDIANYKLIMDQRHST